VDTCDRKPNYKGGQLYRFYCTLLLPCPVVLLNSDGHGKETHWKKTISGHHALYLKIILKTHLKISVCEGVEIFKPVWDILLSRAGLLGTNAVAR